MGLLFVLFGSILFLKKIVDRDGDVVSTAIHLHLLYLRIPDPVVHFAWHENDWHAFRFRNQNPGARIYMNQHRTW
jgi:hypothetical protein